VASDEQVSLVDEDGAVVGVAPRSAVRRDNLLHAATAVLVRHPDRRIYVSRRSADKDWPFVPDTRTLLARLSRDGVGDYALLGRVGLD
jgi:isopentenyldiphosphate isomerase